MKKNLVKLAIVTWTLGLSLSIAAPTALAVNTDQVESKATSKLMTLFSQ